MKMATAGSASVCEGRNGQVASFASFPQKYPEPTKSAPQTSKAFFFNFKFLIIFFFFSLTPFFSFPFLPRSGDAGGGGRPGMGAEPPPVLVRTGHRAPGTGHRVPSTGHRAPAASIPGHPRAGEGRGGHGAPGPGCSRFWGFPCKDPQIKARAPGSRIPRQRGASS